MSGRLSMWTICALCALIGGFAPTAVANAITLPDGRIYEQVTPQEKYGSEVYIPAIAEFQPTQQHTVETETQFTFQAAADGSGIAYVAGPTAGGNENEGLNGGNEYLASRTAGSDWSSKVLSPPGAPSTIFQTFSPNLTTAFVDSTQPLSASAPGVGEEVFGEDYDVLYSTSTTGGEYLPFFSTKPPYRSVSTFGTVPKTFTKPSTEPNSHHGQGFLALEGASSDYTHLLFAANDALTEASEGRPAAEGGASGEFEKYDNLYDSMNGRLQLVNVLPDGTTQANAGFGQGKPPFNHVISADGSRIFWTDLSTGHIYMREDGTKTVEVSPEGTYQAATTDGSTVFYTNQDLYAYDVQSGHTTDLTPGVAVERVVGTSEDGDYIYYVTNSRELMVWHGGVSTPIATLAGHLVLKPEITSEVTPDGRSIVYTVGEETVSHEYQEHVYIYNTESNTLYCASCTPQEVVTPKTFGSKLPMTNSENMRQPRWITPNGDRVFFDSLNRLVPQDTNELEDVYEWERPGTGGCTENTGCVNLLSGGTSTDNSFFLDASETGEDVFIVTRSNFVGSDDDDLYEIYDVRLNAPPAAPVAPTCSGTGCQGVPSAQPTFATPSSVTFEGVGNFAAPTKETKAKPKRKPKPKHKKKRHNERKSKAKKSARKAGGRMRSSSKGGRS